MATYSRRSFLKLLGVSVFAASFQPPLNLNFHAAAQGRALEALAVFKRPDLSAPVVATLWPDSVVTILSSNAEWDQVENGFVLRAGLQPMSPYVPSEFMGNKPFWAEVAAPAAVVRAACAADTPLVARIGHGGVSRVVDGLPGEPLGWYGIEDERGVFLGWTQANRWQKINPQPSAISLQQTTEDRSLQIQLQTGELKAVEQGKVVLQAPCSVGTEVPAGTYYPQNWQMGGGTIEAGEHFEGVPWQTRFGEGYALAGVYWHNRFGEEQPGAAVQLPPLIARWLYHWLDERTPIVIA